MKEEYTKLMVSVDEVDSGTLLLRQAVTIPAETPAGFVITLLSKRNSIKAGGDSFERRIHKAYGKR